MHTLFMLSLIYNWVSLFRDLTVVNHNQTYHLPLNHTVRKITDHLLWSLALQWSQEPHSYSSNSHHVAKSYPAWKLKHSEQQNRESRHKQTNVVYFKNATCFTNYYKICFYTFFWFWFILFLPNCYSANFHIK